MNSGKFFAVLILVVGALVCGPVVAKGLEYNYAELGYVLLDSDLGKADGVGIDISIAAHDIVFVGLSYSNLRFDEILGAKNVTGKQDSFGLSVGGRYSLTESVDIVAEGLFKTHRSRDFTVPAPLTVPGSFENDTYGLRMGLRGMVADKVELNGFVGYFDTEGETNIQGKVGLVVGISKKFSAVFNAAFGDEDDQQQYFLGLRLNI